MKTKILVLTTIAIFIVSVVFATETPKMSVTGDEGKISVSFESANPCPVEIIVTRSNGTVVYYRQSENAENIFNQQLNLSELGNGVFNVSLRYGCSSINRGVTVKGKKVKVGPAFQLPEPFFRFKDDKLMVSFINVTSKNVYLNVYKNGEYFDGFTLGKDFDIQKCVDFSKSEKGDYSVVLTDDLSDHYYIVKR